MLYWWSATRWLGRGVGALLVLAAVAAGTARAGDGLPRGYVKPKVLTAFMAGRKPCVYWLSYRVDSVLAGKDVANSEVLCFFEATQWPGTTRARQGCFFGLFSTDMNGYLPLPPSVGAGDGGVAFVPERCSPATIVALMNRTALPPKWLLSQYMPPVDLGGTPPKPTNLREMHGGTRRPAAYHASLLKDVCPSLQDSPLGPVLGCVQNASNGPRRPASD